MDADSYVVPDLLFAQPSLRIDLEATDTALVFAFAGSTSGGLFSEALARSRLPRTSWEKDGFAADLFVERFVRDCMRGNRPGERPLAATEHLVRLLCAPPIDAETIDLRRGIVSELLNRADLRAQLDALHEAQLRWRGLLEGTGGGAKWDITRRQIEILQSFRDIVLRLAAGFASSHSGLGRLRAFGHAVSEGEPFRSLQALLEYDEELATVDFRVRMGADGRVRELSLLSVAERQENPFHTTPLRRFLGQVELVLRGFRFGKGEVLARLLDAVFEGVRLYFPALVQLLGDVEFYLGALRFSDLAAGAGLRVCLPELVPASHPRRLMGLFNPLLLGAQMAPVPCNIDTDRLDTTLLITGPNSGGKTRLLQSLGLSQMLAQSGLPVPAASAQMALASGLVVSLIQETHADQTEGRLGVELMRIRALFERLPLGAIVILDELCSGTNPSEGEEIFELVVRMLSRLRPQAFITTHFLEFASRLEKQRKIEDLRFLQVVLGPELQPTYQFAPGVATTSLASQAASRLGVTGDQLMTLINQKLEAGR